MWAEYGIFVLKLVTVVLIIGLALLMIAGARQGAKQDKGGKLVVKKLNEKYEAYADALDHMRLDKKAYKARVKQQKKDAKQQDNKDVVYVLSFEGDMEASQVDALREEVTALLTTVQAGDEVVIKLNSPGGVVNGYGLAASQIQRLRDAGVKVTVAIDQVAASGGYMMAAAASHICAAPFAFVGSIGVVAQMPNFHRFLQERKIDVELITAGKNKRTLTMFGENTDEARDKFKQDITSIHDQFKAHVAKGRRSVEIDTVADGDYWTAQEAFDKKLVDRLITSDQLLQELSASKSLISLSYKRRVPLAQQVSKFADTLLRSFAIRARHY
ncbi:protease SohB [Salinibius halmophilus]|uniref:protease SohB n=1 Tax=Salinibius halmophilus TaxID=1853216 RepID=UPI000E66B75B|nr:protease SohB [Salinibius halmophilus]